MNAQVADAEFVPTWIHGEGTSLAVDDAHFPVVIATWVGRADSILADALAAFLEAQLDRAAVEGARLVCIHDALSAGRPRSSMRETWEGVTDRLSARAGELGTFNIIILDDPLVRAAMTAAIFLANARRRTRVTDTRAKAIDMALRRLEERGTSRPTGLHPDHYQPPEFSAAAV